MDENEIKLRRDITVMIEEILDILDENPIEGNLPINVDAIDHEQTGTETIFGH